jgi:hypothetical protein
MKEQRVTLATAKTAHFKGCNEFSAPMPFLIFEERYRPTQSLLQKWLREVHKIVVLVERLESQLDESENKYYPVIWRGKDTVGYFDNYEDALEIGLQEGLKLINK